MTDPGEGKKSLLKAILLTGLLVGTLDGAAAVVSFLIHSGGGNPIKVFVYISSGVFGRDAFEAGDAIAWWGVLFHYFIATSWTTLFFLVYPRAKFLSKTPFWTGIGYGFVIWLVMTQVVLPLSNVPPPRFVLSRAIEGIAILMVMVGLPVSFLSRKYYAGMGNKNGTL